MGENPFHYTQPVPREEVIDREDATDLLLTWAGDALNGRVTGPRRYGKTSLLRKVLRDASDIGGWLPVYVDFFGVLSTGDVAERIERAYTSQLHGPMATWFRAVRRSLKPIVRVGTRGTGAQVDLSGGEATLLERLALPVRVAERSGLRVLVVFDEFQDVLTAQARIDAVIRSEIQHHQAAASYIFAGSDVGMMRQLFGDRRRAFYAQARPLDLTPLAPEAVAAHLEAAFAASGRELGPGALALLLDVAAGHPQRTMLLAHHLWELTPPGGVAEETTFVRALDTAMAELAEEFRVTWSSLSVNERRVLGRLGDGAGRLYTRSAAAPGPRGSLRYAVNALERAGVMVRPGPGGRWQFVDPLFARWVRAGRTQ
jgi:hypothetical protein